jgi:hypothetical protein
MRRDEGWASVKRLIELAKSAHTATLTPARRQRIREGLLRRLERDRLETTWSGDVSGRLGHS